jgi:N-acetylmuramoyl-L-alanine amidase
LGPDPDIVMAPDFEPEPTDSSWLEVEVVSGADTVRARWPLRLGLVDVNHPLLVVVNDDQDGTGTTDKVLAGRPSPWGTYHWFFPNGTLVRVSGRWDDQIRLQLSETSSAWVDQESVYPLPPGTPPPVGVARSLRLASGEESVVLRVPLPGRIPFHVDEADASLALTLYGVAADMDWIHYGGTDTLIRLISFAQPKEDETVVRVELSERVWGYRTRWSGNDLLLEIRRPPTIDQRRPLEGRKIAVDPGHPPGGATGPTGTPESEVTLAIARKLVEALEECGAEAILIRESEAPMGLYERIEVAEKADAELLVSIHANALPDGVNPFMNNGTSVYYFYPRSADLARELNRSLVRQLGFRDLGFGRGNLALVRTTWMPAALTEGLFMMLPDQEAVLVSEEGQWRYARGVVEGIASFLRKWAMGAL